MIISIASGKGGTGKTTVAVNLALSINHGVQFIDCDVEAPNSHIFLKPVIHSRDTVTILVPDIDLSKCNYCGKCAQICAYNAIAVVKEVTASNPRQSENPAVSRKSQPTKGSVLVFSELCHGCGACSYLCPQKAIEEVGREIGALQIGEVHNDNSYNSDKKDKIEDIQFVSGLLNVGQALCPPLIRAVKQQINPQKTCIIDAPPGVSCPVIESVKNSDFCVLVTEPTPFGLNDLILAVETLRKINIPFAVVINRFDLGNKAVEDYCDKENIPIFMRIPYSKDIAVAYSKGVPIVEALPEYKQRFMDLYNKIQDKTKGASRR